MAIEINGKVYRNLQEQVQKNMEDIDEVNSSLALKADKSDTYTKTEVDIKDINLAAQMARDKFELQNEILKKADKTELDNAINDLRWELGSHTLDVRTDTDTKYLKSVPSGAIGCQINKVGGMSYKSDNILKIDDKTFTQYGLNFVCSDNKITLNGTASVSAPVWFSINIPSGTYTLQDFNSFTYNDGFRITLRQGHDNDKVSLYYTTTDTYATFTSDVSMDILAVSIVNGVTYNNVTLTPSLTIGTTPLKSYEPYFDGIHNSAVTRVVSKDSNDTTIDTLTIHTIIKNLTGYGWGVNDTCYNYIDFDRKVFVQKVGRVDLGSLTYTTVETATSNKRMRADVSDIKPTPTNTSIAKILCAKYKSGTPDDTYFNVDCIAVRSAGNTIFIYDSNYNQEGDETALATALSGVYLYYELATPVETDISAYLTTNTIDVEGGGSLEFTNTYSQDVPSDIDYLIEEVKA